MKLNNDSATPFYQQVADRIRSDIKAGIYPEGAKIPSEPELCESFNVSRITVRRAIEELQRNDLLIKKRGKGTYVTYVKLVEDTNAGGSFTKSSQLINTVPSTKVISIKEIQIEDVLSKTVRELFRGVNSLIQIKRVRYSNDIAMIFETDYFLGHQDFIYESDFESVPIMDTITKHTGLLAENFEDMFGIIESDSILSKALNCELGTPLLRIEQKVLTEDDQLIYYNEQVIRQDLYQYVVRTRRRD